MNTTRRGIALSVLGSTALCGCTVTPVYLHSDKNTPVEQLAIIRTATKEERQLEFSWNPFKTNYITMLHRVRDFSEPENSDDWYKYGAIAYVTPGSYIVDVACEIATGNFYFSVTLTQLITANAGNIYALECDHSAPRNVHVLVGVHSQAGPISTAAP